MHILLWRAQSSPKNQSPIAQSTRPSLFLKTIQSLLKKRPGFEVGLFDAKRTDFRSDLLRAWSREHAPALVVVEAEVHGLEEVKALRGALSVGEETLLVLVGQGPSAAPEAFLQAAGGQERVFVVLGEPEAVIVEAAEEFASQGTWEVLRARAYHQGSRRFTRHLFEGFAESPALDYEPGELAAYPYRFPLKAAQRLHWGHVWATRGCPHACTFCTHLIRESYGRDLRKKPVAVLRQELARLRALGVNAVSFADDDLTASSRHLEEICRMMVEAGFGFRWTAHARVDECDPALLAKMKEAGCSLLRFGVEAGSERILRYYHKAPADQLEQWWPQARRIVRECRRLGIQTAGLFILGAPGETVRDFARTLYRIWFTGFDLVQVHFYTPYPDTVEARRVAAQEPIDYSHYSLAARNYSSASALSLKAAYLLAYLGFYLNPWQLGRLLRNYSGFMFFNFREFRDSGLSLFRVLASPVALRRSLRS